MKKSLLYTSVLTMSGFLLACGNGADDSADEAEMDATEETAEDTGEETAGDDSWATVEEEGVLTVGTSGTYAPITFFDENNELTGFEVELVREIGERLDLEVEFETMDFDGILPSLRNGQIDVAAHDFAITEERLEVFDFVDPHKFSYGSVIVRAEDQDRFESAYDLEGVDVAVGSLTSNYAVFADNIGANGTAYDGGVEAILRDVINGNQDAYLNDYLVLSNTLEEFGDDRLAIAEDVRFHATESAMAVLQGNETLRDQLSEALAELQEEGVVSELAIEFLGVDVTEPLDDEDIVGLDGE
ncbi:amino acid ABC transporter substrate-binding protein [Alkalibacterium sp. AK22]|uniref:transporter substrate-binding domain-containing protein n=1 Tax=Alkalibacterium sp. AK22 TaxID=1229520 RepID=UPI00044F122D|nr:transporter substrate-binding domain-containing protein [Alkalibacterium sp. AK22]EXJ23958.1 amino acid ABC transporter substrate-binding protein [Alkalibacterium sp. AK22]